MTPDKQAQTHRTRPLGQFLRVIARAWLGAIDLKVVGQLPDLDKYVIIAAPHKTNWDLPNALAVGLHFGVAINWMGKDSLFHWPFKSLMIWLGGIPVDRSKRNDAVAQVVASFEARPTLALVIPPEGTRAKVTRWKSGFYHIARGAKVPIAIGFVNYKDRTVGIAETFYPTGNYDVDLAYIFNVYERVGTPVIDVPTPIISSAA